MCLVSVVSGVVVSGMGRMVLQCFGPGVCIWIGKSCKFCGAGTPLGLLDSTSRKASC